jgi:phosphoglycolate phosphatase-like HAD superfamily hydrolase
MNPDDELKSIVIDFDKTIAQNGPHPDYDILEPVKGVREFLESLYMLGWHITVWTARSDHFHEVIEDYMEKYMIPYDRIICGKPFAKYYIDDRAVNFSGNWEDVIEQIK